MKNNPFVQMIIIGVVILAGLGVTVGVMNLFKKPVVDRTAFAQCLSDKGITMYGAAWCPHCQNEKARFGDAWKLVPYVECPENIAVCTEKGITGYPTWVLPDGTKLSGEQTTNWEKFSQASACPL
jgi:hypothetical protein